MTEVPAFRNALVLGGVVALGWLVARGLAL
jgi:hypothetical protein